MTGESLSRTFDCISVRGWRRKENVTEIEKRQFVFFLFPFKESTAVTICLTVSEFIVGQTTKDSARAMDMIWNEVWNNNIEINKETQSFHIHACFREHEEIYGTVITWDVSKVEKQFG